MNNNLINEITATQIRKDLPNFNSGDTIKVHVRIKEGEKSRIQIFQGVVLAIRGGGVSKTFIVRKISGSVGVERTFHFNSPVIEKIEVVKKGKVRRNKIFYIRKLVGKAARIKEKEIRKVIQEDIENKVVSADEETISNETVEVTTKNLENEKQVQPEIEKVSIEKNEEEVK